MKSDKEFTERQQHNMKFSEDRIDLLDTVREIIDVELDRRGLGNDTIPHLEKSLPEDKPPESPRCSFWQRFLRFFTFKLW